MRGRRAVTGDGRGAGARSPRCDRAFGRARPARHARARHMTPEAVRQAFPITSTRAYLFSGGLAPAATPVRAAHDRWTDAWMHDPAAPYASYQHEWELARQRFAALIGADARRSRARRSHLARGESDRADDRGPGRRQRGGRRVHLPEQHLPLAAGSPERTSSFARSPPAITASIWRILRASSTTAPWRSASATSAPNRASAMTWLPSASWRTRTTPC